MNDSPPVPVEGTVVKSVATSQEPKALSEISVKSLLEIGIGFWKEGIPNAVISGGRIIQAARGGYLGVQIIKELQKAQQAGKIQTDEEMRTNPYAVSSLVELMKIVDENPETDRLAAIKVMYFHMVRTGIDESEERLAYLLFGIVKKLSSSELMLLKTIRDLLPSLQKEAVESKNPNFQISPNDWLRRLSAQLGYQDLVQLVKTDAEKLAALELVPKELLTNALPVKSFQLTNLGETIYQTLADSQQLVETAPS